MSKVIRQNRIEDDQVKVLRLGDDGSFAELPSTGDVLVPLAQWLAEKTALQARGQVGVWLDSHEEVEVIAGDLPMLPRVGVNFPAFTDGRGYSTCRLLRDRYGYQGPVRALGDVFKDVMFYLKRVGFDEFSVREDKSAEDALAGLTDFAEVYQGAVDQPLPLFRRRA